MKTDLSIEQLVSKVNGLVPLKKDILVNTDELMVKSDEHNSFLNINGRDYRLQEVAEKQLASMCGIPYSYASKIGRTFPSLLDDNYNTLLGTVKRNKLIRTIGGSARAVLSDRYKKFENEMVLATLLPLVDNTKGLSVISSSLTTEKMYVKVVSERERAEVKVGDVVSFGAVITNSEIGLGSITINPFCLRLVCTNGMALPSYIGSTRSIHLGKKFNTIDEYEGMTYDDEYVSIRIKSSLDSTLDPTFYMRIIEKMKAAREIKVADANESIEIIGKHYGIDEREQSLILMHYLQDKDESFYGLVNAVTRTASDAVTYTRASELERIGSDLLHDGIASMHKKSNKFIGVLA